jgi:hypothetical protein
MVSPGDLDDYCLTAAEPGAREGTAPLPTWRQLLVCAVLGGARSVRADRGARRRLGGAIMAPWLTRPLPSRPDAASRSWSFARRPPRWRSTWRSACWRPLPRCRRRRPTRAPSGSSGASPSGSPWRTGSRSACRHAWWALAAFAPTMWSRPVPSWWGRGRGAAGVGSRAPVSRVRRARPRGAVAGRVHRCGRVRRRPWRWCGAGKGAGLRAFGAGDRGRHRAGEERPGGPLIPVPSRRSADVGTSLPTPSSSPANSEPTRVNAVALAWLSPSSLGKSPRHGFNAAAGPLPSHVEQGLDGRCLVSDSSVTC